MSAFNFFSTLLASNPFGTGDASRLPATGGYDFTGSDGTGSDGLLANIEGIISNIIGFLTVLAAFFFIINFVTGAFSWVTAGGDQSKVQQARDKMVNSFIGLIVIVASYGIIGVIGTVTGIDILNIGTMLEGLIPG